MSVELRLPRPRVAAATIAALCVGGLLTPPTADAAEALLSRRNLSQVHTWDSADPGASVLLHATKCNDADINLTQGSDRGWIAEHNADYFGRFVIGSNTGLEAQYNLGQNGLTHYNYPKHITVYNGEIVVMGRNTGTLWRYSVDGAELGSVKTAQTLGQGMATDGVDLYVSLWTGSASQFVRYDANFVAQETFNNPSGMGGNNNLFDIIYDAGSGRFFGLATSGEGGTGTQSTTVLEFEMGGAVAATYTIPFAADGIGAYITSVCGDGVVDGNEACDDGNDVDGDACTNACAEAACGDGVVYDGVEACDDGNAVDGDACTSACEEAACGDGIVYDGVEACDDGNDVDGDACTNACAAAACGDGIVQEGVEACDDGNDNDLDACSNACVAAACGDGVVQEGEACDDGNDVDDDDCPNSCVFATCGDGVVDRGEACDDGNAVDDDACTNACTLPVCGDGIVQGDEECDDPRDRQCENCFIVHDDPFPSDSESESDTGTDTSDSDSDSGTSDSGTGSGGVDTTTTGTTGTTGAAETTTGDDSATSTGGGGMIDSEDGCGCVSGGGSSGGGLFGLALLLGLRRRRQR
ncbi:MAG: DUF4215 domain-containing protein [Nannocystaceae bacterium]